MTDPAEVEPQRPNPNFRIYVESSICTVDVTHAVMDVYDIAVNSMDLGSGFLSTEEVGNLRILGDAIGAERFDYQHDKCLRCGHDYEQHRVTPVSRQKRCQHHKWSPFRSAIEGHSEPECSCTGYVSGVEVLRIEANQLEEPC